MEKERITDWNAWAKKHHVKIMSDDEAKKAQIAMKTIQEKDKNRAPNNPNRSRTYKI